MIPVPATFVTISVAGVPLAQRAFCLLCEAVAAPPRAPVAFHPALCAGGFFVWSARDRSVGQSCVLRLVSVSTCSWSRCSGAAGDLFRTQYRPQALRTDAAGGLVRAFVSPVLTSCCQDDGVAGVLLMQRCC
jgi:hypothetical protein